MTDAGEWHGFDKRRKLDNEVLQAHAAASPLELKFSFLKAAGRALFAGSVSSHLRTGKR